MKIFATLLLLSFSLPSFAQDTSCYETGRKYKTKSALRKSTEALGIKDSCLKQLDEKSQRLYDVANQYRSESGLHLETYRRLYNEQTPSTNIWQKLATLEDPNSEVKFPALTWWVPAIDPAKSHIRAPMKYGQRKTWSFPLGQNDSYKTEARPYVGFMASRVEAMGEAGVEVHASLMDAWEGRLGVARGVAFSPGTGPLSVDLQIVGPDGGLLWNHSVFKALELRVDKNFKQHVAVNTTWRFAIGPIPMAAEMGAVGSVGVQNSFALYPLQVSAWGKPWIAAESYVMAGANIILAGAGTGGRLRLASDELLFRGRAFVNYNEEPTIRLETEVENTLELLAGELFAFVYFKVPKFKWQKDFTFFKWPGFSLEKLLYNSAYVIKKDHTLAFGDVSQTDREMFSRESVTGLQKPIPVRELLYKQWQKIHNTWKARGHSHSRNQRLAALARRL